MVIVEVAVPFAITGPVPKIVELPGSALAEVKTTLPPVLEIGVTIESIFVSAVKEAKVHVATPDALVGVQVP
jgi:hypothetical protein